MSVKDATALLDHALLQLPGAARATHAGTVRYAREGRLFCVLRVLSRRVDVGFWKLGHARRTRILHARGKLPFAPYRVEVESVADVDRELLAWLRESYDLAGT